MAGRNAPLLLLLERLALQDVGRAADVQQLNAVELRVLLQLLGRDGHRGAARRLDGGLVALLADALEAVVAEVGERNLLVCARSQCAVTSQAATLAPARVLTRAVAAEDLAAHAAVVVPDNSAEGLVAHDAVGALLIRDPLRAAAARALGLVLNALQLVAPQVDDALLLVALLLGEGKVVVVLDPAVGPPSASDRAHGGRVVGPSAARPHQKNLGFQRPRMALHVAERHVRARV
jgi:hypothetical protein